MRTIPSCVAGAHRHLLRRTPAFHARFPASLPCSHFGCVPRYVVGAANASISFRAPSQSRWHHDDAVLSDALNGYIATFDLPLSELPFDQLSEAHIGHEIALNGYIGPRADVSKSLSFVQLLNETLDCRVQLVASLKSDHPDAADVFAAMRACGSDVPVAIQGIVQRKVKPKDPPRQTDVKRNEEVEIALTRFLPLNRFTDATFYNDTGTVPFEKRHLQLRKDAALRSALNSRARIADTCRRYLSTVHNFLEIETPLLFKSTPEGAREFLVPTRSPGKAFALPQSPQQYKQILMASGIPRYYQIARCFRDEDLRADRQPEFTQLDLEMAFVNADQVMVVIEGLIRQLWSTILAFDVPADAFSRLSYDEAMARYGSDKPDTRLGAEIIQIGHLLPVDLISKIGPLQNPIVDCFKLAVTEDANEARDFISSFMESPEAKSFIENVDGQPGLFVFDTRKPLGGLTPFGFEAAERLEEELALEEGDIVVIQARKRQSFTGGSTAIGNLRLAMNKLAVAKGLRDTPSGWSFLWINRFPLFSPVNDIDPGQGGKADFASTHHPFTAPATAKDARLLATDPLQVKADHYDLVLNGVELGGGSRRIHDAKVQEYVFRDVLQMSEDRVKDFRHLLDVLDSGCPPHAGFAIGFDRLVATMLGRDSIREVIAFPKSGKGEDPLVNSPNAMTTSQLETYHLQLKAK